MAPIELELPRKLHLEGWKVKISDKERLEPPHVTIMRGHDQWRLGLRDGSFLVPPGGGWSDIPWAMRTVIERNMGWLRASWDRMYPSNPVGEHHE